MAPHTKMPETNGAKDHGTSDYGAAKDGTSYNCTLDDGASNVVPPKKGYQCMAIT